MNSHSYLLKELWLALKLPRIPHSYANISCKIPNIAVKCSKSLFLFYYITFASQGLSLCCTVVKIENTSKKLLWAGFLVCLTNFVILTWNIRSFLGLRLENSISQNIKNFLRVFFFTFWAAKVTSWNVRETLVKKVSFPGIQESALDSYFCKTFHRIC